MTDIVNKWHSQLKEYTRYPTTSSLLDLVGKEWAMDNAKLAMSECTSPTNSPPMLAYILNSLSNGHKLDDLNEILQLVPGKKIKTLKKASAEQFWNQIAEICLHRDLFPVFEGGYRYDEQSKSNRTPDFYFEEYKAAIEHTAVGAGMYIKNKRAECQKKLDDAVLSANIVNCLKEMVDKKTLVSEMPLTPEEIAILKNFFGLNSNATTSDVCLAILDEAKETETLPLVFSKYWVKQRETPRKLLRYIADLKHDGTQVQSSKIKILSISFPNSIVDEREVNKLNIFNNEGIEKLKSGIVWHSIMGRKGDYMYLGTEKSLAVKGVNTLRIDIEEDGILRKGIYDAVVVSFFATNEHEIDNEVDVLPLSLRPARYLFIKGDVTAKNKNKFFSSLDEALYFKNIFSLNEG